MLCLVYPTLCNPMECGPQGSSVHGDSPGKNTGVGCHALLQGNLPNPGIEPRSPTLQVDSLPSDPPGKPENTRVDSLSSLQGIFPTQELNQGLLQCKRILHSLATREAFSQLSPAINFSLLKTPIFQFVWLCCALGTPACVQ